MKLKAVSGMMLMLLFTSMLTLAFNIHPAKATGTIYIRADGSVEPDTAPISSVDNVTYTFTGNIYDYVVVERDNIVVDGAGNVLQGSGSGNGVYWSGAKNVTIKNTNIKNFQIGVYLKSTSSNLIHGNNITNNYPAYRNCIGIYLRDSPKNNISENNITKNDDSIMLDWSASNSIYGNSITNNGHGIYLYLSKYNSISRNSITSSNYYGIWLKGSSNNNISENNITANNPSIKLYESSNNNISENNITANNLGIELGYSSNNSIYHNNFVDNTKQVHSYNSTNVWDDGAGKGNYWSDYEDRYPDAEEIDESGIWNTPYIIDVNNQDNYPLIPEFPSFFILPLFIIATLLAVVVYRRKHSM